MQDPTSQASGRSPGELGTSTSLFTEERSVQDGSVGRCG